MLYKMHFKDMNFIVRDADLKLKLQGYQQSRHILRLAHRLVFPKTLEGDISCSLEKGINCIIFHLKYYPALPLIGESWPSLESE